MIEFIIKIIGGEFLKELIKRVGYFGVSTAVTILCFFAYLYKNGDIDNLLKNYYKFEEVTNSDIHLNNPSQYKKLSENIIDKSRIEQINIKLIRSDYYKNGKIERNNNIMTSYFYDRYREEIPKDVEENIIADTHNEYEKNCNDKVFGGYGLDGSIRYYINDDMLVSCLLRNMMVLNRTRENETRALIKEDKENKGEYRPVHLDRTARMIIDDCYIEDSDGFTDADIRNQQHGFRCPVRWTGQVGGALGTIVGKSTYPLNGKEFELKKALDKMTVDIEQLTDDLKEKAYERK